MLDEKIQAVEKSLLAAISLKDIPQSPRNLINRMEKYHIPGVSIAVINNSSIEWAKGYGLQEAGVDTKVSTDTLFQAASISKPVSAIAALRLVEKGKFDLDVDVNQWLSSWKVPENEHTQNHKVTLRGILSHTAGLTVHGFRGYCSSEEVPTLLQVLDGEPPANSEPVRVDIVPGSEMRYSGGGYIVTQQLLEDVTDIPFQELLQAIVLDELNMDNSTFEQPLPSQYRDRAATAHNGKGIPIEGKWYTYPEKAAAGLWTTPIDLAKCAIEIIQSSKGQSKDVLSSNMVAEMLTPTVGEFGLGFITKEENCTYRFRHGGSNEGFRCYLTANTGTGQGAVVMTNGDNGNLLMMEIVRSIANVYGWSDFHPDEKFIAQVNPDLCSRFEGKYCLVNWPDFVVHVKRENSQLFIEIIPNALTLKLYPESENKYFATEMESGIEFIQDDDGVVNALMFGTDAKMEKMK